MSRKLVISAAVAVAALLCAVPAVGETTPVVSGLDYQDKPLYNDQSLIIVSFKTSRAARPGYEYGIWVSITGKNAIVGECSSIAFSWDRKFGGDSSHMRSAGTHFKILKGTRYGYWCRGSASLHIVEHKMGASAIGRYLGDGSDLYFRVAAAP